jgi:hypothetical protein
MLPTKFQYIWPNGFRGIHLQTWLPQAIPVLDWSISKKSSSLKLLCQNEPIFGGKHLTAF